MLLLLLCCVRKVPSCSVCADSQLLPQGSQCCLCQSAAHSSLAASCQAVAFRRQQHTVPGVHRAACRLFLGVYATLQCMARQLWSTQHPRVYQRHAVRLYLASPVVRFACVCAGSSQCSPADSLLQLQRLQMPLLQPLTQTMCVREIAAGCACCEHRVPPALMCASQVWVLCRQAECLRWGYGEVGAKGARGGYKLTQHSLQLCGCTCSVCLAGQRARTAGCMYQEQRHALNCILCVVRFVSGVSCGAGVPAKKLWGL